MNQGLSSNLENRKLTSDRFYRAYQTLLCMTERGAYAIRLYIRKMLRNLSNYENWGGCFNLETKSEV